MARYKQAARQILRLIASTGATRSEVIVKLTGSQVDHLRSEAINAELSSLRWSRRGSLEVKNYADVLIDDTPPTGEMEHYSSDIRLLPGAKEAVLLNNSRVELWSIQNREYLWGAPPAYDGKHDCVAYDCELSHDGKVVSIAWLSTPDDEQNM